jgi:hypothetical protein
VNFIGELDEILSDFWTAEGLLQLRQVLDHEYLSSQFSNDQDLKLNLDAYINDSYVPEIEKLERVLVEVLKEKIISPKYQQLFQVYGHFTTNTIFDDYINYLLESAEIKFDVTATVEEQAELIKIVQQSREFFKAAMSFLIKVRPDLDKEKILHSVLDYDLDKLQVDVLDQMVFAMLRAKDATDALSVKIRDEILLNHHQTARHHIEYYEYRNTPPDQYDLIQLLGHFVEPGSTKEEFTKEVEVLLNHPIVRKEDHGYIHRLSAALIEIYDDANFHILQNKSVNGK